MIDEAIAKTKTFFALPNSAKAAYYTPEEGGRRGYTPFGTESAKGQTVADLKEFWHTGPAAVPGSTDDPIVSEVDGFNAATRALFDGLNAMGQSLLQAVATYLGLEETWFTPRVANGDSILRLLHYPAQDSPPPAGSVRAAAHEDINVITLLLGAEEAGLEVQHTSGKWLGVNPPPGALVVNIGDMLHRLTNGELPSTTHRVVNPSAERAAHPRYSTPFFLHFASDVLITPLETCIAPGDDALPAITAGDYLTERLREIGLIKT